MTVKKTASSPKVAPKIIEPEASGAKGAKATKAPKATKAAKAPKLVAQPVKAGVESGAVKSTSALTFIDAVGGTQKTFGKVIDGPVAAPQDTLFPDIAESFPLEDLSLIDGKGAIGSKFMLDGSCLAGLQLWVRRVLDGDQVGFELNMRLTPEITKDIIKKMDAAGATHTGVSFRDAALSSDEVSTFGKATATLTKSGSHTPTDTSNDANKWCRTLEGVKGAKLDLVDFTAAKAVRGMLRIQLRGNDAECTKQLATFIKQLGMEGIFAPPTQKSKERLMLMRALWQADNKSAELLGKDLSEVKNADLRKRLKELGYTDERLKQMTWSEVYPGHFTGLDPVQQEQMVAAGARYLYSTVNDKEHVLAILQDGQKASVRRYVEGIIVNGMSTNTDFSSGGAMGVFTRLVTQKAILADKSWTGRTYKIVLSPDLLARTDWYGWNGDFYGRSWELASDTNFGVALVKKIDDPEGYKTSNELIFRTGNAPKHIEFVAATTEAARIDLIKHLEENGYTPSNGKSLEELVIYSPTFFQFGPLPFDLNDIDSFIASAAEQAVEGDLTYARWFLKNGPTPAGRAKLEEALLRAESYNLRELVVDVTENTGRLHMSAEAVKALFAEWQAAGKQDLVEDSFKELFIPLWAMDDDGFAARIAGLWKQSKVRMPSQWKMEPVFALQKALSEKHTPGAPSASMTLFIERALSKVIEADDGKKLLAEYPIFPTDMAWLAAEIAKAQGSNAPLSVRVVLMQFKTLEDVLPLTRKLVVMNTEVAASALRTIHERFKALGLSSAEFIKALKKLPEDSPVVEMLRSDNLKELILKADDKLAQLLTSTSGSKLGSIDADVLTELLGREPAAPALVIQLALRVKGFRSIAQNAAPANLALLEKLAALPLYSLPNGVDAFISEAAVLLKEFKTRSEGYQRLGWLILATKQLDMSLVEVLRALAKHVQLDGNGQYDAELETMVRAHLKLVSPAVDSEELATWYTELVLQSGDDSVSNARWIVSNLGAQLAMAENPKLLDLFKVKFQAQSTASFISETAKLEAVKKHFASKTEAGLAMAHWLMQHNQRWHTSTSELAELALTHKIDPKDAGYTTIEERFAALKKVADDSYTEAYSYSGYDDWYDYGDGGSSSNEYEMQWKPSWPAYLKWLLHEEGELSEPLFKQLLGAIPQWGKKKDYGLAVFDSLLTIVPDAWKVQTLQARKALEES